jgi:putative ABC transport system permease protein
VFLDACAICALGLGIGLPVAAALARFMRGQLYGIEPIDPATLVAAAAVVVVTGLLAAMLPAQRASRVDPLVALRRE